jgi:hypothetical protein
MIKKLDAWAGDSTSSGGKKILIDSSLSTTLYYPMPMFLFKIGFLEKMDKHRKHFFWRKKKGKRSYHMIKWSKICRSKKKGGLRTLAANCEGKVSQN